MKHPIITVVSLGPGDPQLLTLQTADRLRAASRLILRTDHHPCAEWLREQEIPFTTLDGYYETYEDFDEMHRAMAAALWTEAEKHQLVYAVLDATSDLSLKALEELRPDGATLKVLPGLTVSSACQQQVPSHFPAWRAVPANTVPDTADDPALALLVTELDNKTLAGEVKLRLTRIYRDSQEVVFFPPCEKAERSYRIIPLEDLDRQKRYDHTVCVWIPPVDRSQRDLYVLSDLLDIMETVRGQCPWDRQQDHVSLRPYLIEEAWEAVGAIDDDDSDHLYDELGDVLLQIVFHASIGKARGEFDMTDIISGISGKMIRRHAHIFGTDVCRTAEEVADNWDRLKAKELGSALTSDAMDAVSGSMPSLLYAQKLQKKAARAGFGRNDARAILSRVSDKARELSERNDPDGGNTGAEIGELFFLLTDAARVLGLDSELILREAAEKFKKRFSAMEKLIINEKKCLKDLTLPEMHVYWNRIRSEGLIAHED